MAGRATKRTDKAPFFPNLYACIYEDFGSILEFCRVSGLDRQTLYPIIYGDRYPSYDTIRTCVTTTGKPFEWLFKEVQDV